MCNVAAGGGRWWVCWCKEGTWGKCLKYVYKCKEILKLRRYEENIPEFDLIRNVNVKEQLAVARIFTENMKIVEKLSNENG